MAKYETMHPLFVSVCTHSAQLGRHARTHARTHVSCWPGPNALIKVPVSVEHDELKDKCAFWDTVPPMLAGQAAVVR